MISTFETAVHRISGSPVPFSRKHGGLFSPDRGNVRVTAFILRTAGRRCKGGRVGQVAHEHHRASIMDRASNQVFVVQINWCPETNRNFKISEQLLIETCIWIRTKTRKAMLKFSSQAMGTCPRPSTKMMRAASTNSKMMTRTILTATTLALSARKRVICLQTPAR